MNSLATLVPLGWPSLNTVMLISNSMSCGPSRLCIKLNRASLWNFSKLKITITINECQWAVICTRNYSLEIIMVGASYFGRRLCVHDIHVEVDVLIPTGSFQCKQGSSLWRQRQIRHQCNEVEGVRHRSSVAFRIALIACQGNSFASTAELQKKILINCSMAKNGASHFL